MALVKVRDWHVAMFRANWLSKLFGVRYRVYKRDNFWHVEHIPPETEKNGNTLISS